MAESDWFVLKRHIEIINMILVMGFPICFINYLFAILKAKFDKVRLLFIIIFKAPIHMLSLLFYNNANVFC
ncbi:MAG: hypothetical protein CL912_13990 [Deltaproteobacteria bacterium]|nr:hypothetical protein [Deltaproteobacteria bacterium]